MKNETKFVEFKSNEDFYSFVDVLRVNLSEKHFPEASQKLNFILNEMTYTTSSEMFGDLRLALLEIKAVNDNKLPKHIIENIDICLKAIKKAFDVANG